MNTHAPSRAPHGLAGRALRRLGPHFGHPRGLLGYAAATVMARSNTETNRITVTTINPAGLDVLDLGCGPGTALHIAATLEQPPATLTGVDQSAEMTRYASVRLRRLARTRPIHLHNAPAEHVPLADETIDLIWAINTVHHWTTPDPGLAEASRLLRSAGHLVIAERYGPPNHRHRPAGTNDAGIEGLIAAAHAAGLTHRGTEIRTTSNDRAALMVFSKATHQ